MRNLPLLLFINIRMLTAEETELHIVWKVASGGAEVDVNGHLVITPSSIIHLDCLYRRIDGNPQWKWSATQRSYPTGWSINKGERELHYRLSIYYAEETDSGMFICTTPQGQTSAIDIIIKDVSCEATIVQTGMKLPAGNPRKLGAVREFSCEPGYRLIGTSNSTCLPSGNWSSEVPVCRMIRCRVPLIKDPNIQLQLLSLFYQGKAEFQCPKMYTLKGKSILICQSNSEWSNEPPTCQEIFCPPVMPPTNGRLTVIGNGNIGTVLIFSCVNGYILDGFVVSRCGFKGEWTRAHPKCNPACSHPGEPKHGLLMPRKAYYEIGAEVLISCSPGFRPVGPDRLTCLETQKWSSPLTLCIQLLHIKL